MGHRKILALPTDTTKVVKLAVRHQRQYFIISEAKEPDSPFPNLTLGDGGGGAGGDSGGGGAGGGGGSVEDGDDGGLVGFGWCGDGQLGVIFSAHFFLGDIFLAAARPPTNMTAPSATVVVAVLNTVASAETASAGAAAAGPATAAAASAAAVA
uniref:Uncharacterized protein n=1 Tax=Oryza sativa subsp. japonica TaxID=39947 RepID=Q6H828_ORYSJ|nr:hypothetical protein [Oryza sativa Japonica Group]